MIELTAKAEWRKIGRFDMALEMLSVGAVPQNNRIGFIFDYAQTGNSFTWICGDQQGTTPTIAAAKAAVEQALRGDERKK